MNACDLCVGFDADVGLVVDLLDQVLRHALCKSGAAYEHDHFGSIAGVEIDHSSYICYCCHFTGTALRAVEHLKEALSCAPDDRATVYNLMLALRKTGRLEEAKPIEARMAETATSK